MVLSSLQEMRLRGKSPNKISVFTWPPKCTCVGKTPRTATESSSLKMTELGLYLTFCIMKGTEFGM